MSEKKETRVVKLHVNSFIEHGEAIDADSHRAHEYYNELMAVWLPAEQRIRDVMAEHVPEIAEANAGLADVEACVKALFDEVKKERKRVSAPKNGAPAKPTRVKMTDEQRERLDVLKGQRAELWSKGSKARQKFWALVKPAQMEFDCRSSGVPRELIDKIAEVGARLREAKKLAKRDRSNPECEMLARELNALKAQKKALSHKTHTKRAQNTRVFAEMAEEPEWHPAWKRVRQIEVERNEKLIELRAASGLGHGTYSAVESAIKQAFDTADDVPHFAKWHVRGVGRKVGWQVTGKVTWAQVLAGKCSKLRVLSNTLSPGRRDTAKRHERTSGKKFRHRCLIVAVPTVKSRGGEQKVATAEVLVHRSIPDDAILTWIYWVPKRVGFRVSWSLQLTFTLPTPLRHRERGQGECMVRLRWSRERVSDAAAKKRGVVVAEVSGEPFAMDGEIYARMRHSKELRAVADMYFLGSEDGVRFGMRDQLIEWMRNNPKLVPDWMAQITGPRPATQKRKALGGIEHWRRRELLYDVAERWIETLGLLDPVSNEQPWRRKVQALWLAWKAERGGLAERFGADRGDLFVVDREELDEFLGRHGVNDESTRMAIHLDWWRRKDKHLMQWAADEDMKARRRRADQYRCLAAKLRTEFDRCALFKLDLAETAKRKTPDCDDKELLRQARYQRTAAAPYELKLALKHAFGSDFSERERERSGDDKNPGSARVKKTRGKAKVLGSETTGATV